MVPVYSVIQLLIWAVILEVTTLGQKLLLLIPSVERRCQELRVRIECELGRRDCVRGPSE